jgi:hypothetical protein
MLKIGKNKHIAWIVFIYLFIGFTGIDFDIWILSMAIRQILLFKIFHVEKKKMCTKKVKTLIHIIFTFFECTL